MAQDGKDAAPAAYTDFSHAMSYGDYLHLDTLLGAQESAQRSARRNALHRHASGERALDEARAARAWTLHARSCAPIVFAAVFKATARISRIQAQLIQSWDVLATMTPADYLRFRDVLGHSSGFQSAQYRRIEYALGNKAASRIAPHRHRADLTAALETALITRSLYDAALHLLARRGMAIDTAVLERDVTVPHVADPSVLAAWLTIYRDTPRHFDLYELAEELVDIEDCFQQWRFRHVTTVQRIIGFRSGTGGTAGVAYLKQVLDVVFFPELWTVRTSL